MARYHLNYASLLPKLHTNQTITSVCALQPSIFRFRFVQSIYNTCLIPLLPINGVKLLGNVFTSLLIFSIYLSGAWRSSPTSCIGVQCLEILFSSLCLWIFFAPGRGSSRFSSSLAFFLWRSRKGVQKKIYRPYWVNHFIARVDKT